MRRAPLLGNCAVAGLLAYFIRERLTVYGDRCRTFIVNTCSWCEPDTWFLVFNQLNDLQRLEADAWIA